MAVLRPLKVVLTNYPEGQVEMMQAMNHPNNPDMGTREIPFSRELWIEQDDFMIDAPRKFFRLKPGGEVRLRFGYIIKCEDVIKDADGNVVELHCSYDPDTRSGTGTSDRKVKGTIHWVSAAHALPAEVRLYDHLFTEFDAEDVAEGADVTDNLNPRSLEVLNGCLVEPSLADASPGDRFQFERTGYFCVDRDASEGHIVFHRTVTLRDTWSKVKARS